MRAENFKIAQRPVGNNARCFVIAEAGVAHFGSVDKAKMLVDLAVKAKADAVKFQAFNVDDLISREAQEWKDRLANRCLTNEEFLQIKNYCDESDIIFLATPHDEFGLDILIDLDVAAYKIGSGELGNWPFLENIARLGKPIILSTGMYELDDVKKSVEVFERANNSEVALLHCVTAYPTPSEEVNLSVISLYRELFGGVVGYSDHTEGSHIPLAAVALGADVVEKHISLDFNVPNAQDWKVSCGPHDFVEFVQQLREVERSMGKATKVVGNKEIANRTWACKSLVITYDHMTGDTIGPNSLAAKRPGTGIGIDQMDEVLGRKLKVDLTADSVLKWEFFE